MLKVKIEAMNIAMSNRALAMSSGPEGRHCTALKALYARSTNTAPRTTNIADSRDCVAYRFQPLTTYGSNPMRKNMKAMPRENTATLVQVSKSTNM